MCVEPVSNVDFVNLVFVSEKRIRKFLNGLTDELDGWGEICIDRRDNSRCLRVTGNGYAAFVNDGIVGIGYIYKLSGMSEEQNLPIANVSIVVKKEFQGNGIGQQFHEMLEKLAREHMVAKFYASQDVWNKVATHLVRKRGWSVQRVNNKYIVEKNLT